MVGSGSNLTPIVEDIGKKKEAWIRWKPPPALRVSSQEGSASRYRRCVPFNREDQLAAVIFSSQQTVSIRIKAELCPNCRLLFSMGSEIRLTQNFVDFFPLEPLLIPLEGNLKFC